MWAFPGDADLVLGRSAVSSVGGLDLDQLWLFEKGRGDAESKEPSAEVWALFLSPCLAVCPLNTLPWCDSVGSSLKQEDYSEERLFWSFLAKCCSLIGRKKKMAECFPRLFLMLFSSANIN